MKDVVCEMEVGDAAKFESDYKGRKYLFCSKTCKDKFDKNPEGYAK